MRNDDHSDHEKRATRHTVQRSTVSASDKKIGAMTNRHFLERVGQLRTSNVKWDLGGVLGTQDVARGRQV